MCSHVAHRWNVERQQLEGQVMAGGFWEPCGESATTGQETP